ncbi:hypothetical protein MNBD_GAMMA03-1921 [hydrothermal vent metagenome]|uniref:3-hydroxyacyl-[acyl-carrier-protein] dehydratase n=1 Tax=hydrothermal vent metagenome TaxID=652676 RepID=A0A3B0WFN3_9ZZZZ
MKQVNLSKEDIESLIPHSEGMCLLESVTAYSEEEIVCQTQSHLLDDNPLKIKGRLSKMHLIEYGAQAIAVHGGLIEKEKNKGQIGGAKIGYIAMVKSVVWGVFNPLTEKLMVRAKVIVLDDMMKRYRFSVIDSEQQEVCSGSVLVVIQKK